MRDQSGFRFANRNQSANQKLRNAHSNWLADVFHGRLDPDRSDSQKGLPELFVLSTIGLALLKMGNSISSTVAGRCDQHGGHGFHLVVAAPWRACCSTNVAHQAPPVPGVRVSGG